MAGVSIVRDGDFVGVVAPTERAARRAAAAIEARRGTCRAGSALVRDDLRAPQEDTAMARGAAPLCHGRRRRAGKAARSFEASYRIPYIAHVPLEPRAAVAEWDDGKLTVWTGTQRPFGVRTELAEAFRIPEDRVRVIVPDTGSAYGGKHTGEFGDRSGAAREGGRPPVKLVWTRAEEFAWAYFRPAGVIDIKSARRRRRAASSPGSSTTGTPAAPASGRRTTSPNSAHRVPSVEVAAAAGLVSRARGDREPLRARDAHGRRWRARSASTRSSSGCGT